MNDSMKTPTTTASDAIDLQVDYTAGKALLPEVKSPTGMHKAIALQLSRSPHKSKKTIEVVMAKPKVPEHNHRVSNKSDIDVDLESIPLAGASNSPSPRSKNKSDSSNKNSNVNKKNYFDDTNSDDGEDIEDENDAEREFTSDNDSNFEGEDVEYEDDAGSLEYNQNNVEVDDKDASHLDSGAVRIVANPSIPPLPPTLNRLRPPPVVDLTGNTDADDDDVEDDEEDDNTVDNNTPFADRKKRAVGDRKKRAVSDDDPDHILSQQLAQVSKNQPTVQEWNQIMDNYQEEEYNSVEEVEIPAADDDSMSKNKKFTTNTSARDSVNCSLTPCGLIQFPIPGL
jgi:hypothetical protein